MENFLFLKPVRPFPTPVTENFLSEHASDKWAPRGFLKKNAIPYVCALVPAAQTSRGTGWEPTKAHWLAVLGPLRGGWDIQRAGNAMPCTTMPTGAHRAAGE